MERSILHQVWNVPLRIGGIEALNILSYFGTESSAQPKRFTME
jgi:hypothetical protein